MGHKIETKKTQRTREVNREQRLVLGPTKSLLLLLFFITNLKNIPDCPKQVRKTNANKPRCDAL